MKRKLFALLLILSLFFTLPSCQDRITIDEYDVADAPIARPRHVSVMQYHVGCLYFPADTVMRYSINSGTLTAGGCITAGISCAKENRPAISPENENIL